MLNVTMNMRNLRTIPRFDPSAYTSEAGHHFTEVLDEIMKAYPNLRFYRHDGRAAWIYFDESDLYAVALISYSDARLRIPNAHRKEKLTYNLSSRMIELPENTRRCNTKEALIRAVGTKVKALTPAQAVYMATNNDAPDAIRKAFGSKLQKLNGKRRELGFIEGSAFEDCLVKGLIDFQRAPQTTATLAAEFLELHRELETLGIKNKIIKAVFFDFRGAHVFDVGMRTSYDGVPTVFMASAQLTDQNSRYAVQWNELDPTIKGRVDVLNIMEPMEFVHNVGLKHSDRLFYVVI